MKLVIDRARWHRGKGGNGSALVRDEDKKMCCLGFFGCALGGVPDKFAGVDPNGILGLFYPIESQSLWAPWLFDLYDGDKEEAMRLGVNFWIDNDPEEYDFNTTNLTALAVVNDSIRISEEEREAFIKKHFEAHGVEVEFVG